MDQSLLPALHTNPNFHAQHSPMGAYMSFTCGRFGARGGFGVEIGRPGNQEIFVGVKKAALREDATLTCLPFFASGSADESARFLVEGASSGIAVGSRVRAYEETQIERRYGWASDAWSTPDLTFTIYTPFSSIKQNEAPLPAISAEFTVDNRRGRTAVTGVFAVRFPDTGLRLLNDQGCGFALRDRVGVLGELEADGDGYDLHPILRWDPADALLDATPVHLLGNTPGMAFEVPAGERRTLVLALGCFVNGNVTTGLRGQYAYTRRYSNLMQVLREQLKRAAADKQMAVQLDKELEASSLNRNQKFLIAHATRSYYGNTQLLDVGGEPFWIVNEGEYCMMNTLDLSVDQMFWELDRNPWVVHNLLDRFSRHYSFVDQIKVPKPDARKRLARGVAATSDAQTGPRVLGSALPMDLFDLKPGGVSFCHDMGVHNQFSPPGTSSYEIANIVGCFSHMTSEELCNWCLMAACYVHKTGDDAWLRQNQPLVVACVDSMRNRGGGSGFCQYDSARCMTGSEITSYDSLDHSLAQTRNNLYMAVKCWATYLGLAMMLQRLDDPASAKAIEGARRTERTILKNVGKDGVLPAVFEKGNPGARSRILPAVEGLIYPKFWNDPAVKKSSKLVSALRKHVKVLLDSGTNVFDDGGIKLTSTSNNSWMSKIAIFTHICRTVLDLNDRKTQQLFARADEAHARWQTEGDSVYWACSDQMVNGVARGSKYYPRIISTALWLNAAGI